MARKLYTSNRLEAPTPWQLSVSDLSTQRGATTPARDLAASAIYKESSMLLKTLEVTEWDQPESEVSA